MKRILISLALILPCLTSQLNLFAQEAGIPQDSVVSLQKRSDPKSLHIKQFILPSAMFLYGVTTLHKGETMNVNKELREELNIEYTHPQAHFDNYLQYAPAASFYALKAMGVPSQHGWGEASMIYLTSNVILGVSVYSLKHLTHEWRPDHSDQLSFPSGHTATAFAGAEFLREEYKDVSPWIGVAGYAMATATGFMRMYNNEHWLGDVVAGAGIGIASTRIAYWLYPLIERKFSKGKPLHTMVMPGYGNGVYSVAMVRQF
ncbi:MAG TPA: phosphatase PAP2 family protein [Chitinophagaceae bacterium]|nr:phosphatase PAP2 family protein [Chitinophagaceae bacterium]